MSSRKDKTKYSGVSIPIEILKRIDELIKELGYWPSRGAFAREACLEKIKRETQLLKELKEAERTSTRGTKRGSAPDKRLGATSVQARQLPKKEKEDKKT